MIIEYYKDFNYLTQKITCKVELFGKQYYYLKDIDGSLYLTGINEDGTPKFA